LLLCPAKSLAWANDEAGLVRIDLPQRKKRKRVGRYVLCSCTLFYFFSLRIVFFPTLCSIYGPLPLNANLLFNVFFLFPSKKEQIIKKGKQKENGIEKVFLLR
jgi:hypothetical protein